MKFNNGAAPSNSEFKWIDPTQDDAKYNGIPNGTYQFICLFGNVGLNGETDTYTLDTYLAESNSESSLIDTVAICQLQNKASPDNKYLKWLFTGADDPMVKMGYATDKGYAVKRTPEVITRLMQVTGQNASYCTYNNSFINTKVHLPFAMVEVDGKGKADLNTIQYVVLGLSTSQVKQIITSFTSLEGQKAQVGHGFNPNPFGYLLKLIKNKKAADKKQCYQWTIKPSAWHGDVPNLLTKAQQLYKWNNDKLVEIVKLGNGGELGNADNVWRYLMQMTGCKSVEEVDARFNIRISSQMVETSVVSFAGESSVADFEQELLDTMEE